MLIAIFTPDYLPESFRLYADNLTRELRKLGCQVVPFSTAAKIPSQAQLLWDPRAGGGNPPILELCGQTAPLVVTLHGVAPLAIPLTDYFSTPKARIEGFLDNRRKRASWRKLNGRYAAIITVSNYSKETIIQHLPVHPSRVFACHNAVDHKAFHPSALGIRKNGYFLHISNDEPRKNIDRLCAAYFQLPNQDRPQLLLKLPASSSRISHGGIEVIRNRLSDTALLELYQDALAFVFPSLYEGFGLPILEAMASGCPVITANNNACAEVAGKAALTVAPHSIIAIRDAMQRVMDDNRQREQMMEAGLRRAKEFSWAASARCHLDVFNNALRDWNS
jgi:glycosyltransferase involved in cell wall biosynthesis